VRGVAPVHSSTVQYPYTATNCWSTWVVENGSAHDRSFFVMEFWQGARHLLGEILLLAIAGADATHSHFSFLNHVLLFRLRSHVTISNFRICNHSTLPLSVQSKTVSLISSCMHHAHFCHALGGNIILILHEIYACN